mmetsp:Transcript_22145/g.32593  ORF Transcript_22145/g.32593 Transcript_22145/m.32593 type:complete len:104 (-) Transcript_22145:137-448(-)
MVPSSVVILKTIVTSNLAAVFLRNLTATRARQLAALTEDGLVPQKDGTGAKMSGLGRVHLANNVRCRVAHMKRSNAPMVRLLSVILTTAVNFSIALMRSALLK